MGWGAFGPCGRLLDFELGLIEGAVDVMYIVIQVIADVVDVLSGHSPPHFTVPTFTKTVVDPSELVALTHELAYRCASYDTFGSVVLGTSRKFGSPFVCPVAAAHVPGSCAVRSVDGRIWLAFV